MSDERFKSPVVGSHKNITIKTNMFGKFTGRIRVDGVITVMQADTLDEVKDLIDKHLDEQRKFKPIDVIGIYAHRLARITSKVVNVLDFYWISFKDERGKSMRHQGRLSGYSRRKRKPFFCFRTPENLELLELVLAKVAEVKEKQAELSALEEKFTDFVTEEYIKKQMGV